MKYNLREKVFNFSLFYLTLTGIFNGVVSLLLSVTTKFCIDVSLLFVFLICNVRSQIKINKTLLYFFSFYLSLTVFFLLFYTVNNNYGFMKLIKNVILTTFYLIFYIILFIYSDGKNLDGFKKGLFVLIVLLEIVLFVFYVLYNKNNGLLGNSPLQIVIFQDYGEGRFQGSFSEPSYLGMCLGVTALLVLLISKSRIRYLVGFVLVFILYYACRAKFAMVSLPLAFLAGICCLKLPRINYIYPYLLLLFSLCFIALFYEDFVNKMFYFISQLEGKKESTGTYVTRSAFLFTSIKELFYYPIGMGMGLNFEYFREGMQKIIVTANRYNLYTSEIRGYLFDSDNFGSKETLSVIISSFGITGLLFYIKNFSFYLGKKYKNQVICNILIFFIFLQSVLTTSIVSSVNIIFILYAKMALHEHKQ
jgi:hypothetical protein